MKLLVVFGLLLVAVISLKIKDSSSQNSFPNFPEPPAGETSFPGSPPSGFGKPPKGPKGGNNNFPDFPKPPTSTDSNTSSIPVPSSALLNKDNLPAYPSSSSHQVLKR